MGKFRNGIVALAATLVLGASIALAGPADTGKTAKSWDLGGQVRKQLVTLPYYGVFDNLAYQIDGNTVTLSGQVVRSTTRSSAESRVKRLAGVEHVVNNITVLPPSFSDDAIRSRTYRAIFGSGGLYRYAMGANPSLHIVVNHGHVTLEGIVSNKMDAQLAFMAANGVPGVFSVTNHLRVSSEG